MTAVHRRPPPNEPWRGWLKTLRWTVRKTQEWRGLYTGVDEEMVEQIDEQCREARRALREMEKIIRRERPWV